MSANTREDKPPASREVIVGANVRRLREAAGISQTELANLISKMGHDLGEQVVGNIENGRRRIRIDDLYALGQGLGVAPMSLLNPGAGNGQLYEVAFEGGITERVTADDCDFGEQWIRFRLQGQPVYVAATARVFGLRINPGGDRS
jgi:transcriptional regulator with XRE-family HTH domain